MLLSVFVLNLSFIYFFHYLYASYQHLLLSLLHFAIPSSFYNIPCNRFCKNHNGNGVVIVDRKFYNNAVEEIISDTSKFEKLNEDPTLKREASLQRFLRKLKQKNFF